MLKAIFDQSMTIGFFGTLCLLAILWFCGIIGFQHDHRESLPDHHSLAPSQDDAVVVTVAPVQFRTVQRSVTTTGTLYGFEEVTVAAKAEGRVLRILHDVSDRIKPAELLLEVDPTDADLAVKQAEYSLHVELARLGMTSLPDGAADLSKVPYVVQARARLENARARHERLSRLARTGSVSAEEIDAATGDFRAAQAELAQQALLANAGLATAQLKHADLMIARQRRRDIQVHAPVPTVTVPGADAGLEYSVTQRLVAEGSYVRPGTELFRLVVPCTLKLRAAVPERYQADLRVGQQVQVTTASSDKPVLGTVARIYPAVDTVTRAFEIEAHVPNAADSLRPGNFAKVHILTRVQPDVPTVPLTSLVSFAGINKVFLLKDGHAVEVQVVPGLQTTEWVEIASPPVSPGAVVLTSGQSVVADRTPVVVRDQRVTAITSR